jgi:PKHD-type hydroxylase
MISSYFTEPKFNLDQIPPIINPEDFKNKTQDFWYLKNHDYQPFAFSDNVFCEDELNRIIKLGNLYVEEQAAIGGTIGAVNKDIRACKLAWMFPNKHTEWIYQRITDVVNQTNEEIFKFDLTKMETFQFTKYKEEESGFYEKHVDPMVGQYLPENRKLSLVVQLSDPDDYEGGDLCLYTGKDPTIIEKKRGRVVFFPSYTLHEVKPVTKGTRYTLVGWVHGPAFK